MFWVYCGLFVLVIAVPGFTSSADSTSKREADYTLDDSFWNEESPVGEVERLLREYRQNQELVRNIGAHYYQIIYPVQLRHHEKMGISTREVGAKNPPRNGHVGDNSYQNQRGRSRTGKHYHRTSILLKAFNHKFRLDLELNTQLLAPNLMQKHFLPSGVEQVSNQEIEHCFYHGTVKDYPGASAAFHTCDGVSGVIHLGNETFVMHPFYGGDMSQKHPHVIFEARTKANKGCANLVNNRPPKNRRQKHILGLSEDTFTRYKRDVREATKYIETAMIIDKAMFDKRNGSTRMQVVYDAIQVANIADLYFRTLNTRVSVVYIETWLGGNKASINKSSEINKALENFSDYTKRRLFRVEKDTTQLLTGETFHGESGIAVPETVCSDTSVGISVDLNSYEPHLVAGTMAHMIGHNIGMRHDNGREQCVCKDWHGCIMAQSIVGLENVQPYKFSGCSKSDYEDALRQGHGICLLNKPNELASSVTGTCGNKKIDDGEDCDCGTIENCHEKDPCCDPITCKLTSEAECAGGPCCDNCKLRARGVVCRESTNECDLSEVCSGESGQCPVDVYKKNGSPCDNNGGYCFDGVCPALNLQCEQVWGYGGIAADKQCFEQFNSKGAINGHCGTDSSGHLVKCEAENIHCGSLQCQSGNKQPVISGMDQLYSRTIISIKGQDYECKSTTGTVEGSEMPDMGLVRDGTTCGDNLICVNQTCTSRFPHEHTGKCPTNRDDNECSGKGICTNRNKCHCNHGWAGPDCSILQELTTAGPITSSTAVSGKSGLESKMAKKETPYGGEKQNLSTPTMVVILVVVVKSVFICFALMAGCYRRKSTIQKYDPPYLKKPAQKNYTGVSGNHNPEDAALDRVNKMLTFGSMPSYSRDESQRVLFRPMNNVVAADGTRLKEHKPQTKRSGIEVEDGGTGAEEAVSFIDLPPNSLAKLPEKGILKKHGGYGIVMPDSCIKEKWADVDSHESDNQDAIMSQSENNLGGLLGIGGGGTISEVERTLKSLNGYHEDIIEALRNAASHRGLATTPSGSCSLLNEDAVRKSLADCGYADSYGKCSDSQENMCDNIRDDHSENRDDEDDDGAVPPCGPIRIRNLEDLIRQLEHHSTRNMSPSGSEDIRISESDRQYRIDSSVCSESSQGSRRCSRGRDDDSRFVYARYRQPSSGRSPYGTHQRPLGHQMHEEEGIYETADPDRGSNNRGETPDSESDAFIQAQQQLARWTNEDGVQYRPPQQSPPFPASSMGITIHQPHLKLLLQLRKREELQRQKKQAELETEKKGEEGQEEELDVEYQEERKDVEDSEQRQQQGTENHPIKHRGYYPSPPHSENGLHDMHVEKEAINAQSQQQNPPEIHDGIDVNHMPNVNNCPLNDEDDDDNFSLDCNIKNDSQKELLNTNNTSNNENTALLPPSHFPEYKH
ncbi:disintegrin and metalloproteinase domain-containing protein unc-71 isoform X3 [Diprion similis]|uniref:disintegrin and metalloproteinase domain-containing protein unc-71 isoform X3 n=1 Tax=Diprion similis TaxID=362088 RepID=UPI001EF75871|nr:disintegrin and metalloproteinase domain-containing protein unc-71 isoform X3 [Diprion similis]